MLKLYHGRTSVCSLKVRLVMAEKNVGDFESQILTLRGDQYDPAYLKLNPNAVVPTLVHDGNVIIESTVIMHYLNDAWAGPSLMPDKPLDRAKVHTTTKLMDEYVHNCCTVITFATVNRANLLRLSEAELEEELAKSPSKARAELKRQVAKMGLDAPLVETSLRVHEKLLNHIDKLTADTPFIAGETYSLADAAATPYVWRLDKLKLARMWDKRPNVARWFERVRARPSFNKGIESWLTPDDLARYANFEPDPWPKVAQILQAA